MATLTCWDEGEVEHTPDDVETPTQRANTGGRNLDDHKIEDPCCSVSDAVVARVVALTNSLLFPKQRPSFA